MSFSYTEACFLKKGCKYDKYIVHKLTQNFSVSMGGGNRLKSILTYLFCIKYNEINICHSDMQKYFSYEK